ncbi:MAG: hypothetical protein FWC32_06090 [Firmicutes bacterium]|nr:hypothetical protein [Bacillota bacterium]
MIKKYYAEVTSENVNVFSANQNADKSAVYKGKPGILVANVRQTAIRVVDIDHKPVHGDKWDLVKAAFPIGEKMNENTHIFDGAVFVNANGVMRFFITALPISVADKIAETGLALFGSPHKLKCLDTLEHFLFRYYTNQSMDAFWVVFPQDCGLRVLFLTDGLPRAAWHVSNNPQFRQEEILRCLKTSAETGLDIKETARKRAVVLNTDLDLEWLYVLLAEQGIEAEKREYCLNDFVKQL